MVLPRLAQSECGVSTTQRAELAFKRNPGKILTVPLQTRERAYNYE